MNSKGHFLISLIKSVLRMLGCISYFFSKDLNLCLTLFFIAEGLGVIEELVDHR